MKNLDIDKSNRVKAKTTKKLLKALKRAEHLTGKPIRLIDFLKTITGEFHREHDPNYPMQIDKDDGNYSNTGLVSGITFECDEKTRRELEKRL